MGQCQGMYQTPVGPGGIPLVTSFAVEKQSPWALPCGGKKKYIVRENFDYSVKNIEPLLDKIDEILSVSIVNSCLSLKNFCKALYEFVEHCYNSIDLSFNLDIWNHWDSTTDSL